MFFKLWIDVQECFQSVWIIAVLWKLFVCYHIENQTKIKYYIVLLGLEMD